MSLLGGDPTNLTARAGSILLAAVLLLGAPPANARHQMPLEATADASPVAAPAGSVYVPKASYLVDSKGGSTQIRRIPAGSQLLVKSNTDGWINAVYGKSTGWIKTSLTVKSLTPTNNKNYTRYIKQDAPLRDFTNAAAPALRTEQGGTQVTVEQTLGEWVQIADGTKRGWVNEQNDLETTRPYRKTSGTWFAKNDIPLRPTTNYSTPLLTIPGGSKVAIKSYAHDWCQVTYNGKTGYVMAENKDLAKTVPLSNVADYTRYAHHDGKVRKTPTTKPYDASYKAIAKNDKVTVTAKVPGERGWVQVKYGSYVGYMIEADDLMKSPADGDTNVADYGMFTTAGLNLRSGPGTNHAKVLTIPQGNKVTVTHKSSVSGWVKIAYGSKTGYVSTDYLTSAAPYSVAVYGTLRTGQEAYYVMGSFQQKIMDQRISSSSLYQLWNRDWTFLTSGPGTVVAEQFQYGPSNGASMLGKLDIYEGQLTYEGQPMYSRQRVTLSDKSRSWTYKTTATGERIAKESGTLISSGDFLKRS